MMYIAHMKPVTLLFCTLLFSSCLLKPKLSGKVWSLTDVTTPATDKLYEDLGMAHPNLGGLGSFLRFYGDGTYTGKVMTGFRYGKWSIGDGDLVLTMGDTSKLRCKIVSLKNNELILRLRDADLHYEPGPVVEDKAADAFSLENNRWEIPARVPESDAQILARVRGHLRCELQYIQNAIDLKEESLSMSEFVTPLAFYGNGIGLKPKAQIPGDWTRLFHDSADAKRGYQALHAAFQSDVAIPNTQNTFLLYKGILEQLYTKAYLDTSAIIIVAPKRK